MSSLANLPRDILVNIVTGSHYSFLALDLWKTGDRIVQNKLENGVLALDLRDNIDPPASSWPFCLSRFRKLRHLRIEVEFGSLCTMASDLQRELLQLSPDLQELSIFSCDQLFTIDETTREYSTTPSFGSLLKLSLPNHSFRSTLKEHRFFNFLSRNIRELSARLRTRPSRLPTTFVPRGAFIVPELFNGPPHLERIDHLELRNVDSASLIPSTLQVDSVYVTRYGLDWVHQQRSLQSLKVVYWTPQIAAMCPPTLLNLCVEGFREFVEDFSNEVWVPSMPPMLVSLRVNQGGHAQLSTAAASRMPRSLTELLGSWTITDELRNCKKIDLPNLKVLEVNDSFDGPYFQRCPDSVTSITTDYRGPLSYLPPNLTYLCLGGFTLVSISAPLHAPFLRTLKLLIPASECDFLPPSLTSLDLNNEQFVRSPKLTHLVNLQVFKCDNFESACFPSLPRTLQTLDIENVIGLTAEACMEHCSALPSTLRVFRMRNTFSQSKLEWGLPAACFEHLVMAEELWIHHLVTSDFGTALEMKLTRLRLLKVFAPKKDQSTATPSHFSVIKSGEYAMIAVTSKGLLCYD